MAQQLFVTARQRILQAYEEAGQNFVAGTLPYHSTRWLQFDVVDPVPGQSLAFAVCRANQNLSFFDYGVGNPVLKRGVTVAANETDTNLAKAKSTNGAQDYVIEGVGFSAGGSSVFYEDGIPQIPATDPAVIAAIAGTTIMCDPAAIVAPPQKDSPFNLEQMLLQAVMPYLSLEFEWDRGTIKKLGRCDLLPQSGAASYLRANGAPESANRYTIPEGYMWRRDGQPDSEFVARVRTTEPVVIPLSTLTFGDAETPRPPTTLYLDLTMRVFGLAVDLPSMN